MSPRGRRPGGQDTRAEILHEARTSFAEAGFAGTTVRGVARAAEVDPALVHHYFGSKADLFLAALEIPVDPRRVLSEVAEGGLDGFGERLLGRVLAIWDDPTMRLALLSLLRSAVDPAGNKLLGEGFLPVVLLPVVRGLGVDQPERRLSLAVTQVIGLLAGRYLLELEPLASAPADEVAAVVGPTLQRYLADPLPGTD